MTNSPQITYDPDTGLWTLETTYLTITNRIVPAGFQCDLASIPRLLWPLVGPFELSVEAPLTHDYYYRNGGFGKLTRKQVDRVFLDTMRAEGVPAWRRYPAYIAVRLFGRGAWRG